MSLLKEKIELELQEAELQIQKRISYFPPILKWILIFCVIGLIPSYYIAKQISYSIAKKQFEKQLTVAKPSFQNPILPKVEQVQIFNWNQNTYSVMATVSNQNIELSAPNVHYQFKFYDANNKNIIPETGLTEGNTNFIANKTQNIVLPRILSKQKIYRGEIIFNDNIHWQKRLDLPNVKIVTTLPKYENSNSPFDFKVTGFVENLSIYELGKVRILLLVKDTSGKIISLSERSEFSLKTGERRSYTQIWPNINFLKAASVEAVADTDILDTENLKLSTSKIQTDTGLDRPSQERN